MLNSDPPMKKDFFFLDDEFLIYDGEKGIHTYNKIIISLNAFVFEKTITRPSSIKRTFCETTKKQQEICMCELTISACDRRL